MLNISHNKLNKKVTLKEYEAGKQVIEQRPYKRVNQFLAIFTIIGILILFLPWTQTISGIGYVTTLTPDQRPQTIQSQIPGRIEQWYVREGDLVNQGDTILRISEVKDGYFDPNLIERTAEQVKAKENSVGSYQQKESALTTQIGALQQERGLKLEQAKNKLQQSRLKVKSDSIDLEAAKTNLSIAERQYNRTDQLQDEGLKAVTDVEEKKLKLQETQAKLIAQENKLMASRNDVINAQIELNRLQAEYTDKISKAQSERSTASSNRFNAEAEVSKLKNAYSNYEVRTGLYYVKAPQNGYINKAIKAGIGTTFKEGEEIVNIMPASIDLAVETFVEPIDLPLLHLGDKVRVQFDGWPAIVFSGWPNASYGTYGATVVAIENFISANGKYRVLLAPDSDDQEWPEAIRVGSGASTLALLDDVPIWFELWRKLNGFPPNYYQPGTTDQNSKK